MSWISEASLYGLLPVSMGAVAVAGMIAAGESLRRRRLVRMLDTTGDMDSLRQEIARIEHELTTRRSQLADIDQREIEAKQRIAQASRLEAQIAELESQRDRLSECEQRTRNLQAEADNARVAREVARSQLSDLENRRTELVSATASLEARMHQLESELESTKRDAEDAQRQLDERKAEVAQALSQCHHLNAQLDETLIRRNVAETMLATAAQKLQVLERREQELAEIEQRIRDAKTEYDHLCESSSALAAEVEVAKEKLAALTSRSEAISDHVEQLKTERLQLQSKSKDELDEDAGTADLDRLAGVWKPVFEKRHDLMPQAKEAERLNFVGEYLRAHGLVFHDRVLYAFHTALKTSREATLLILAGISGTGKSLLPQRYAEGMGMNFLLVPVQPRWDGPQDLLGFYNFLENKYVATDLIRALAQMHQYPAEWNLPEELGHVSLKDQMLLVLLDEMNLARIEYYFSDLLVKLETRRTIANPDLREQRIAASIELNSGAKMATHSRGMHVFPGSNSLFVGTMNEDESTQSISDKVTDRANVMRFSRPKMLQSGLKASSPSVPPNRLKSSDWHSWQDPNLSGAERDEVDSAIDRLNEALDTIERPFGHRVKQAIVQYVAMYPRRSPDAFKHAIADQIEMRILPKVRGMELESAQDCLGQIEDLARQYDPELADAIENSRNLGHPTFHWQGFSRDTSTT